MYTILPKFGFAQKLNPNGYSDYVCVIVQQLVRTFFQIKNFLKGSPSSFKFGGRIKRVLSAPKSLKGGGGERRKSLSQFFKPKSAAKVSTEVSESFTFENLSSSFNSLSLNNAASSSGTTG